MNRVWIGIASDLSQDQVLGVPYQDTPVAGLAAASRQAPVVREVVAAGQGRMRLLGALAVALAVAVWLIVTPADAPPEAKLSSAEAVANAAPDSTVLPAQQAAASPVPAARGPAPAPRRARTPSAPVAPAPTPAVPEAISTDTEIQLEHYRSLSRGL